MEIIEGTKPENRLEWALALAAKGFKILALRSNDKRPVSGRAWGIRVTSDPDEIRAMFAELPGMNYGVCPGSGFAIIDLDTKHAPEGGTGLDRFGELELEHGITPETFRVRTRSGGLHIFLRVSEEVGNANKFPDGIDVRGGGGYVVGPGCFVPIQKHEQGDGHYRHESGSLDAIAECPEWVHKRLGRPSHKDPRRTESECELDLPHNVEEAERFLARREPAIQGQNGDDWTWNTVAFLRDIGLSYEMALAVFSASEWNERCEPPWEGDELETLVANAYNHGTNRPGSKRSPLSRVRKIKAEPLDPGHYPEWRRERNAAALAVANENPDAASEEIPGDVADDNDDSPFGRWSGAAMRLGDAAKVYGRPEFLIPGFIRATGVNAILAFRETGKTLIMVDIALRGALDMDWHGWPIIKGCYHFMFASEDTDGTTAHVLAWCKRHEIKPEQLDRFILIPEEHRPDLTDAADCDKLAAYLRSLLPDGARGVVYLDTWQAMTVGASQKEAAEMSQAMRNADALAKAVNGAALAAYHPPKSGKETLTGAGQLEDAGFSIVLAKEDPDRRGRIRVESMRLKGAPRGAYLNFKIEGVEIGGTNAHGQPYSGAIIVEDFGRTMAETPDEKEPERLAFANVIRRKMESAPNKEWTFNAVAVALKGQTITLGNREVTLPGQRKTKEFLEETFKRPVYFPGERLALELVETDAKRGRGAVRKFQLQAVDVEAEPTENAIDAGETESEE